MLGCSMGTKHQKTISNLMQDEPTGINGAITRNNASILLKTHVAPHGNAGPN